MGGAGRRAVCAAAVPAASTRGGEAVARAGLVLALCLGWLSSAVPSLAASPDPKPSATLTLGDALDLAAQDYPAVKAALEEQVAAQRTVDVARAAFAPQVNLLWQINRATVNNITGFFFPQGVLPSITGPVLPSTGQTTWDDGAGVLVDWNVFDGGVRSAHVAAAREASVAAQHRYELTRIEVIQATADAYLNIAAAQALARTAQANVDRLHAFGVAVHVLVNNKLRPGVDAAQADAAESLGRTQLIAAQENIDVQLAILGKLLGRAPEDLRLDLSDLMTAAPADVPVEADRRIEDHPAAQAEAARVRSQEAQLRAIDRSYTPHLDLLASASERGSGKTAGGQYLGGSNGLGLGTGNWGAGVQVSVPLGSFLSVHAQQQVQSAEVNAERFRYDQTVRELDAQLREARAALGSARSIARLTPIALAAARTAEEQQRVRYKSGLANVVDVTAAEAALAQAENQDAVARLDVWLAWANYSAAAGDFSQFRSLIGHP
jgi:outer membrane protein